MDCQSIATAKFAQHKVCMQRYLGPIIISSFWIIKPPEQCSCDRQSDKKEGEKTHKDKQNHPSRRSQNVKIKLQTNDESV